MGMRKAFFWCWRINSSGKPLSSRPNRPFLLRASSRLWNLETDRVVSFTKSSRLIEVQLILIIQSSPLHLTSSQESLGLMMWRGRIGRCTSTSGWCLYSREFVPKDDVDFLLRHNFFWIFIRIKIATSASESSSANRKYIINLHHNRFDVNQQGTFPSIDNISPTTDKNDLKKDL